MLLLAFVLLVLAACVFAVATFNTPARVSLIGLGLMLLAAGEAVLLIDRLP